MPGLIEEVQPCCGNLAVTLVLFEHVHLSGLVVQPSNLTSQ